MFIQVEPPPYAQLYAQKPLKGHRVKVIKHRRKRRIRVKRFSAVYDFLKSYFSRSSIHGFAYVVHSRLTWFESGLWLILMGVCLGWCIVLGLQSIDRFKTKSTVVALERDFYFWNTSLPSLTICPMQRISVKLFDEYCSAKKIEGSRKTELFDFLESLANSTYTNFGNISTRGSIDGTLDRLKITPDKYMQLIFNLTFDGRWEPVLKRRIRSIDDKVHLDVRQVLTEYGLCYMTNNFLSEKYTSYYFIFGKYPDPVPYETDVPIKVFNGTYIDPEVGYNFIGFNDDAIDIYIHSAYEVMRVDLNYGWIDESVEFDPQTSEIITDDNFEEITTISQRRCRFPHETNLTHFPLYTKFLCQQECRLNLVYEVCKCIPHFYPNRIKKPKQVCHYRVLKECFSEHKNYFLKLFRPDEHDHDHEIFATCYCMQNCRDSVVSVRHSHIMRSSKALLGSIGGVVAMKVWPHMRLKRQVIYSFTDLLVSVGGAAGLFLGFSVLGAIEFIYYFTMRLIFHLRGYKI